MRPLIARQNRSALRRNFERFGPHAWAVVKADGYGMGATQVAASLPNAQGFAVASLEEAMALRESGIRQPILALEGCFDLEDARQAAAYAIDLVIHQAYQLQWLESLERRQWSGIWLKLDTGMHRLGLEPGVARQLSARVNALTVTRKVWMSHYASADLLDTHLPEIPTPPMGWDLSINNSAAQLMRPGPGPAAWPRAGIALYGGSPDPAQPIEVATVQTLESKIVAIRDVPRGDAVGYGGRWVAQRDSRIATLPGGYADGYTRAMPDGTPVFVEGVMCALAGRVSMDRITIDVTDYPHLEVGARAQLWGDQVNIDDLAARCGTIAYELFCNLAPRVKRVWSEGE